MGIRNAELGEELYPLFPSILPHTKRIHSGQTIGKVKSIIETYPLAEAAKAYERVAEGKTRFRAVLTM
jgi:hypothetical protein